MMSKNVVLLLVVVLSSLMAQSAEDPHSLGWLNEDPSRVPWMKEDRTPVPPSLPTAVDHSAHMPPVTSQQTQGSCTAFALCYYYKTYQEWLEHGWSVLDSAHQFSPSFAYNQANRGGDIGSYASDVMKVILDQGCASLHDFPYNTADHTSWPSETAYYHALPFRARDAYWIDCRTDDGILALKAHIAAGDNADLGFYVWGNYDNINNYDTVYCVADKTGSNRGGHHNCIVGYDDSKVTHDGTGAFRIVNSWGAGWGNHGYAWISYEAVKNSDLSGQWVCYLTDRTAYSPSITARFRADHAKREYVTLTAGIGPTGSPHWTRDFYNWQLGVQAVNPFPSHDIILDLSDGAQYLNACDTNPVYIQMQDNLADGVTGTIRHLTAFSSDWGEYSLAPDSLVPIPDDATPATIRLDLPARAVQWQCAQHFPARTGLSGLTGEMDTAITMWSHDCGSPVQVAPVLGDLDGDGRQDVVACPLYGRVMALRGATGDTLWTFHPQPSDETPPCIADVDGDHRLEVLVAGYGTYLYALDGATGAVKWQYPLSGMGAFAPAVADLDGDGRPEVTFSAGGNPWAVIALNGEDGSLLWSHPVPGEIFGSSVAVADINADGAPEVVFGSMDHNLYFLNGADGTVAGSYLSGGEIWYSPTIADVDADGCPDIIFGATSEGLVYAVRGLDDSLLWTCNGMIYSNNWPAVGDINNDGQPEVVVAADGRVQALTGADGDLLWSVPAVTEWSSPVLADVNGDGRTEVVYGTDDSEVIARNGSDSTVVWRYRVGGAASALALGDVDGDGALDVVVGSYDGRIQVISSHVTGISDRLAPHPSPLAPTLTVSPNPCTDLARITVSVPASPLAPRPSPPAPHPSPLTPHPSPLIRLALYDRTGRLVRTIYQGPLSTGTSSFLLHPSSFPAGVYFLSWSATTPSLHGETETFRSTVKLAIQH